MVSMGNYLMSVYSDTSEHFIPSNFNNACRNLRSVNPSIKKELPALLGYVDYNAYRKNCTVRDTVLLRQLGGRFGVVIYKVLLARREI